MPMQRARAAASASGVPRSRITERPAQRGIAAPTHLDEILDAAETVVLRQGIGAFTLDAVSRQAGLSKAGLLHHFPSKDALIDALVVRQTAEWHSEFRAEYQRLRDAGDPRPAVNAMMCNCLAGTHAWSESERARNRVMVAALVHDERHVDPLREVYRDVAALLDQDDLPPGAAETIHLAVHGLWFQWIFGMGEVTESRLRAVRGALAAIGGFAATQPGPKIKTRQRKLNKSPSRKRGAS